MGLFNRPYWRDKDGERGGPGMGGLRLSLPRPGRAVIGLMIACGAMFLLPLILTERAILGWLALRGGQWHKAWTFLTFQFIHDGPVHLFMNMMGLYFFGPPLEERWGARRFLCFYLSCGVLAGGTFILLALAAPSAPAFLVGASGGVLACVAASAVLMPEMNVLLIPIRWAAAILLAVYLLNVATGLLGGKEGATGDAAHLGGMVAGGAWAMLRRSPSRVGRRTGGLRARLRRGAWRRRQEAEARRLAEVDRILDKVKQQEGIASLTGGEKKTLQEETQRLREGDGPR